MGSVFVFWRGFCPKSIDDLRGGAMAQCPPKYASDKKV